MNTSVTRVLYLGVTNFRNIASADIEFGARFNVVYGDNGQGKTNLLEATYVACTSKSFRANKLSEVTRKPNAGLTRIKMSSDSDGIQCSKDVRIDGAERDVRIDGKSPENMYVYAARTPVVVFHPQELNLSMGPSVLRRKLLDRAAMYAVPASMRVLAEYKRAMRSRQSLLASGGVRDSSLEIFERVAAERAMEIRAIREQMTEKLAAHAGAAFERLGTSGNQFSVGYRASGGAHVEEMLSSLLQSREDDRKRGYAAVGPHRDDLVLRLDGKTMRGIASQGQHRLAVLALKMAEMHAVAEATGSQPVLLLDDISSELDASRTASLFRFLDEQQGQVIVTTTRPELVPEGSAQRVNIRVATGEYRRD